MGCPVRPVKAFWDTPFLLKKRTVYGMARLVKRNGQSVALEIGMKSSFTAYNLHAN